MPKVRPKRGMVRVDAIRFGGFERVGVEMARTTSQAGTGFVAPRDRTVHPMRSLAKPIVPMLSPSIPGIALPDVATFLLASSLLASSVRAAG